VTARRAFLLAHQWVGLAAAAFLVVIAIPGSALVFENEIDRALNPAVSWVPVPDGRTPAPLEELVSRVNAERPDDPVGGVRIADRPDQAYEFSSRLRRSTLPANPKAVFRILKKFPEDRTPAGRSRVYIDQFSGAVLLVENTRTAPLGTRILNLKRSAHTGDIFGAPTQALYFPVSLGMAIQAVTGVLIWWNSRKRTAC